MPCYHLQTAYKHRFKKRPNGKAIISFSKDVNLKDWEPISLPCGKCVGCRLEYSRQWAMRGSHEAKMHEDNCYLTLTYNNDNLPEGGNLEPDRMTKFMKDLRDRIKPTKVRFMLCGEYGEQLQRPHYHLILFGYDFPDRKFHTVMNGHRYYTSLVCSQIWPEGFNLIGDVTFETIAYVARYITKKINGKRKEKHYESVDVETGLITNKNPEFFRSSRRPGIGLGWYNKFADTDIQEDTIIIRGGHKVRPPRFYDKKTEEADPEGFKVIKERRLEKSKNNPDNKPDRIKVREHCKLKKFERIRRPLEEGDDNV